MNHTGINIGFPNNEPAIGPTKVAEVMGWSRKKAWQMLNTRKIRSIVTDVTARGIERRTCQSWLREYIRSLNGRDEA